VVVFFVWGCSGGGGGGGGEREREIGMERGRERRRDGGREGEIYLSINQSICQGAYVFEGKMHATSRRGAMEVGRGEGERVGKSICA
jgi:hypothetical protein